MSKEVRVIVYGASEGGKNFYNNQRNFEVIGFADSDEAKQESLLYGKKVYAPEELLNIEYDLIIIASSYYEEIRQKLLKLDISPNKIKGAEKKLLMKDLYPFTDALTKEFAKNQLDYILTSFKKKKIKCFLGYGTLLGMYREGDLISWDDDIDLLLPIEDYDEVSWFISREFETKNYLEIASLRSLEYENKSRLLSLNFKDLSKGIKYFNIDLSFFVTNEDRAYYNNTILPNYHFSKSEDTLIRGKTYPLPQDVEVLLRGIYGLDWKKPDPKFTYSQYENSNNLY